MNPVEKILGDSKDYCKICGAHVGKENVYGKKGCSECAYMNEED